MLIPELLPFLEGVARWETKQLNNVEVNAGQTLPIVYFPDKSGYLYGLKVSLNNPYGYVEVEYKSLRQTKTVIGCPTTLYEDGLTSWNGSGWFVSRYDTTENVYTVEYLPAPGGALAWQTYAKVSAVAPQTSPVTIRNLTALFLVVEDDAKFVERLRYLHGGSVGK
ncbi:MAG: hypothetical protein ACTSSJ_07225 [Candidatus Odinarchaeia archaeon]